ncbi:MAG TPA: UvrD-helicase domain-containing protein [Candidatus Saccharimonadales bacterium]|nr:UvrD-helicase domain-containing protein [Candidatus Saccharimonadales bacterium]
MDLLEDLNEEQRRAVEAADGAVLVLAGAGSGKTRVLVHKIAHILRSGRAAPDEIVAVTFTNRAAGEMKERVAALLGTDAPLSRVGTFHSLCLRMLRREAPRLGYRDGFQVYDTDDSVRLVKECIKAESLDEESIQPRDLLRRISSAKNRALSPDQAARQWRVHPGPAAARIFSAYEAALRRVNAMDFDDLILNVLRLFEEHPDRAALWAGTCRYLLVDEYQDTNPPQYRLIRALSAVHGNLSVVGDEDQAIYRFRGADIGNILSFKDDFPDAQVIKLTRNYRSTGAILDAANSLVSHNKRRIGKDLWTPEGRGDTARLTVLPGDREEAAFVLGRLRAATDAGSLSRTAILYRTNAQSRLFEEALVREGVPYRIYGSVRFYERREIRDLMAYLRLAINPDDDVSFRRIVNTPPRGIGRTAMMAIEAAARAAGRSLWEGLVAALREERLPARAVPAAGAFRALVESLRRDGAAASPADLLRQIISGTGYEAWLRKADGEEAEGRLENVDQLLAAAEEISAGGGLQEFLDRTALVSDTDEVKGADGVNLMTLHSAKGLEFETVFLVGMEEGLLPHSRTLDSPDEIEEERRLCYVGMTRAKRWLRLTAALQRRVYGQPSPTRLSRFVDEIDDEHLDRDGAPAGSARPRAAARQERAVSLGDEDIDLPGWDDDTPGFRVGARVRHDSFGLGEVVQVEPSRGGQKLTVIFRGGRVRKLMTPYARLTAVPRT